MRGAGGVRTQDQARGTYIGAGARLQAGQRLVVPDGTIVELRLGDGTLLRLNEDTLLRMPDVGDRALELSRGELVAIVAAGHEPLQVRAGLDSLAVSSGEARVWSRGDRRSYDLVYGTARLGSEGREVEPVAPARTSRRRWRPSWREVRRPSSACVRWTDRVVAGLRGRGRERRRGAGRGRQPDGPARRARAPRCTGSR